MNPCRCGRASEPGFACKRGAERALRRRLSGAAVGPLLDRIDLHIEVPAVTAADLILPPPAEGSARGRGARRARPRHSGRALRGARPAARPHQCAGARRRCWKKWRKPDSAGLSLLRDAADAMRLSARGYHRVLRVARTLADLDGAEKVGRMHLAEALSYRALADEMRRAA